MTFAHPLKKLQFLHLKGIMSCLIQNTIISNKTSRWSKFLSISERSTTSNCCLAEPLAVMQWGLLTWCFLQAWRWCFQSTNPSIINRPSAVLGKCLQILKKTTTFSTLYYNQGNCPYHFKTPWFSFLDSVLKYLLKVVLFRCLIYCT